MYFLYYRFASVILGLRQFLFVIYYAYTVFFFFNRCDRTNEMNNLCTCFLGIGAIIVLSGVPMYYLIQKGGNYGPMQNVFATTTRCLACLLNVCLVGTPQQQPQQ